MGLGDGRTFNLWEAFTGLIPVIYEWVQANTLALAFSTCCNRALSSLVKRELTSMDSKGSIANCSLSSKGPERQALIAMLRGEFRGASYQGLYPFQACELATDSTDEQLIGYPGGQPARM